LLADRLSVIAAFEDSAKLVERIRGQREESSDGERLPEEPTRDLLDSLALGPAIVRGHYEHDLKRFGEQYACGDIHAREQMKDILISLQMTLIITLRSVYMDGMDLDFHALQTSSDDCRVNAGVCLGQLSQRLSEAAKAQTYYSPSYSSGSGLMPPMSPSLGYSSSRSTHSSVGFTAPRTPDPMTEQFQNMTMSGAVRPPYLDRAMSSSSGGSQEQYPRQPVPLADRLMKVPSVGVHRIDESDAVSLRRRSSQALAPDDNILLLFPQPGGQPGQPVLRTKPPTETDRASLVSSSQTYSADMSRASSGHRSQHSRDRFGPDDYGEPPGVRGDGRQYSHGTIYDMYQPSSPETPPGAPSYSQRAEAANHGTLEHVRFLQEHSRPPRTTPRTTQPRSDSLKAPTTKPKPASPPATRRGPFRSLTGTALASLHHEPRRPVSKSITVDSPTSSPPVAPLPPTPSSQVPTPEPPKTRSIHLSPVSLTSSHRADSIHTVASSDVASVGPLVGGGGPLALPTDKHLLGFCKGAFRLQAGLERKAFSLANRPAGFSGMVAFWRCEKCNFEGPVHTSVGVAEGKKKGKPERSFDPKVRVSEAGGVRYRWAFLARCHVPLKGMVPHDTPAGRDGGFGGFGCIFCCAEGKNRGWLGGDTQLPGSGSIRSARSGNTANTAVKVDSVADTPIFGNVASFLQHLEHVHRPRDGWPGAEMLGRFRVVVGQTANSADPGWEVNFVPF
jgi:hypothetical protein